MQKIINYRISIYYSTVFIAIIFALLSLFLTSQMIELDIGFFKQMIVFVISFIYIYGILLIMQKFINTKLYVLVISIFLVYYLVYAYIYTLFGFTLGIDYINVLVINGLDNFIETSGLDKVQLEESAYILLGTVLVTYIVLYYINTKTANFKKSVKFVYLFVFFSVFLLADQIYAYKKVKDTPNSIYSILSDSIIYRPSYSSSDFYYNVKEEKFDNSKELQVLINNEKLPNIILIMAESLRSDMYKNMNYLSKQNGTYFKNNYSTSNGTYFGLFSTLYGLYPNYYWQTINDTKPTLISMASQLNYEKYFYSSDKLSYGELDKWIKKKDFDSFNIIRNGEMYQRDQTIVSNIQKDLIENDKSKFFLITTNTTHFDYSFDENLVKNPIVPYYKDKIDYFDPNLKEKAKNIFNRYQNSVKNLDIYLKQLIETLKETNQWENTIFIVFGDHGEEFFETGKYTHASALNTYQLNSFLWIHLPSDNKALTNKKTTSLVDIPMTLISYLKNNNNIKVDNISEYSGYDILDTNYKGRPIASFYINPKAKSTDGFFSVSKDEKVFMGSKVGLDDNQIKLIDELRINKELDFE
ncbi:hypothetical protein ALC152_14520 [Arcobacter sp. 15-2]|uniref:sulfatase-like hydrolase/transferase n=1 Tax=Arcobacter sp. 15-2 TaxID=3374109 RepID=UPI00399C6480